MEKPEVSILCITYNQVDYIRCAMDSFLMQRADFEFEILVNDDASTDGTTEILLDYQAKYPDKVRVVTHEENEWSRGNHNIIEDNLLKLASGKYMALCEGDDYWTDVNKLQKQHDAMCHNKNAVLCVHASRHVDADTGNLIRLNRPFDTNIVVPVSYLIREIHPFATNSFFIESDAYRNYQNKSNFINLPAHGDHKMQVYFATHGEVIYLSEPMSAYRVQAKGSVNASHRYDESFWLQVSEDRCHMLSIADEMDEGRHHDDFERAIRNSQYNCLVAARKFKDVLKRYPDMVAEEPWARRLKFSLYAAFPTLGAWVADILGK